MFESQEMRVQTHEGSDIVSVRCADLEAFLAKVALALGVDIRFGVVAHSICTDTATVAARPVSSVEASTLPSAQSGQIAARRSVEESTCVADSNSCDNAQADGLSRVDLHRFGFDVLVAADGSRSMVRESLGLPFDQHTAFMDRGLRREIIVPKLRQTTVIVRFKPLANGSCPAVRSNMDPFEIRNREPGITAAFKRFFFGCDPRAGWRPHATPMSTSPHRDRRHRTVIMASPHHHLS
jgi:flavin-dependent dehydrogenase